MSKLSLILIPISIIALFWLASWTRQPESRRESIESRQPVVPWVHDFGVVRSDETVEHRFVIPNTSQNPVRPQIVTASCSCLKVAVERKWYNPEEEVVATVRMTTNRHASVMNQRVVVTFENKSLPDCVLKLQAVVRPDLYVSVSAISIGEDMSVPATLKQFQVSNYGTDRWSTIRIHSNVDWASVSIFESAPQSLEPNTPLQNWNCSLDLNIQDMPPGAHKGALTISDEAGANVVTVPIELMLHPAIKMFPGSWYFFGGGDDVMETKLVVRSDIANDRQPPNAVPSESLSGLLDLSINPRGDSKTEFMLIGRLKKRPANETRGEVKLLYKIETHFHSVTLPVLILP